MLYILPNNAVIILEKIFIEATFSGLKLTIQSLALKRITFRELMYSKIACNILKRKSFTTFYIHFFLNMVHTRIIS